APAPFDKVVAVAAEQSVGPIAAGNAIVARAGVDGQINHAGSQCGSVDRVVPVKGVNHQVVIGAFGSLNVDGGMQAGHREIRCASADLNRVLAVGAVDDDGVGCAIAGAAACGRRQVEVDFGHVCAGQVVDGDGVGSAQGAEVDLFDAV